VALALIVPAFTQPLLTVEQPGATTQSSLLQGIQKLWDHGNWGIAVIVGVCSVLLPVLKLVVLLVLNFTSDGKSGTFPWVRSLLQWLLEKSTLLGMLDVLIIAVLLFSVQRSSFLTIDIREGVAWFVAMVGFSYVAVHQHHRVVHWGETHDN